MEPFCIELQFGVGYGDSLEPQPRVIGQALEMRGFKVSGLLLNLTFAISNYEKQACKPKGTGLLLTHSG